MSECTQADATRIDGVHVDSIAIRSAKYMCVHGHPSMPQVSICECTQTYATFARGFNRHPFIHIYVCVYGQSIYI
jgi:hypothetical protein